MKTREPNPIGLLGRPFTMAYQNPYILCWEGCHPRFYKKNHQGPFVVTAPLEFFFWKLKQYHYDH